MVSQELTSGFRDGDVGGVAYTKRGRIPNSVVIDATHINATAMTLPIMQLPCRSSPTLVLQVQTQVTTSPQHWVKQLFGRVKFNVDGAMKTDHSSDCGGVLRGAWGECIVSN